MIKKYHKGFTVIELVFVIVVAGIACIFFFVQKQNLELIAEDNVKKTAINAMYYSLEEVFYPANGYYPQAISKDNLKSVDPDSFTDPEGKEINTAGSSYTYTPTNCKNGQCLSYTLTTRLNNEDDFTKTSQN